MGILRDAYPAPQRSTAVSIYQSLTQVANEHRTRSSFTATRKQIAELAGVHPDTLDDYVAGFVKLGLLLVQRRKSGKQQLPSCWTLTDPEVPVSHREGPGAMPGGVPVPHRSNTVEEEQEQPLPLQETSTPATAREERMARPNPKEEDLHQTAQDLRLGKHGAEPPSGRTGGPRMPQAGKKPTLAERMKELERTL